MGKKRTRARNRVRGPESLQQSVAKVISEIGKSVTRESIGSLRRLLKRIAKQSFGASTKERQRLRKLIYKLIDGIGKTTVGRTSGGHNLLTVITFLRGKFARGRGGYRGSRALAVSSLSNYFTKLAPALKYGAWIGKRFEDFGESTWEIILRRHPSSARILTELLETALSGKSKVNIKHILYRLGLIREKSRRIVEFIPVTTDHPKFKRLTMKEQSVLVLALDLLMRESEITAAKIEMLSLDPREPGLIVRGKGNKERFIRLRFSPRAVDVLQKITKNRSSGFILCKSNGSPYSGEGIDKMCSRALRKLGFLPTHIHFLRHLGINRLLLAGTPMDEVSDMARHANIKTTDREYTHVQAYLAAKTLKDNKLYERIFRCSARSLSVGEVAAIVGCGKRNIQRALKKGRIGGQKIGSRWRIPESEAYRMGIDFRSRIQDKANAKKTKPKPAKSVGG